MIKKKRKKITCYIIKEGGGLFYLWSDVPSDIRGVVTYCDSLYILLSPVGSELVWVLSSNCEALGSSPTFRRIFLEL